MGTLSKKLTGIEGRISGLISVHYRSTRSLRISRPNGLDERAVSTRRVTKKKYSDLPKVQLLPDGEPAMPLPDWEGGLLAGAVRKRSARLSTGLVNNDTRNKTVTVEEKHLPSSRKRRVRKTVIADGIKAVDGEVEDAPLGTSISHNLDETQKASLDQAAPKSKRVRRTKINNGGEENAPESSGTSQPRNQLATEILNNRAKFPHCILLTRVGQFYESYFDQAAEVSRLLNIKLAQRTWDKHRVPMCGFPLVHLDKNLKILVQQNRRFVAICEEFPRSLSSGSKEGFNRRVSRIVTPGTLIDESFLNPYENNYLLAINPCPRDSKTSAEPGSIGLAWIDISTGEFFTNTCTHQSLQDQLARLGPREVVLNKELELEASHPLRQILLEESCFISYIAPLNLAIPATASTSIDDIVTTDAAVEISHSPAETQAIELLTTFLRANLLDHMPQLTSPSKEPAESRLQIDSHTIKALEIRESIAEGGMRGTLLSVIKRTVTSSGTRLLARWLCSPSTSVKEIEARQSLVSFFYSRPHLRDDLSKYLTNLEDVPRIVQKLLLGRGDASDLASIHSAIGVWQSIKERLDLEKKMERLGVQLDEWASIDALMSRMNDLQELSQRISFALRGHSTEEPSEITSTDGGSTGLQGLLQLTWRYGQNKWAIAPEFSDTLATLHDTLKNLLSERGQLERELQRTYNSPSLTLRSTPEHGMHVHVQRSRRGQSEIDTAPLFIRISESGSTRCYFYKEWSTLGSQILNATTAIFSAEKEAFESLRSEVIAYSSHLRRNARLLDELDVTLAFASLAVDMGFVRPILKEDTSYEVTNGRHPTVELGLLTVGRVFTPNSVLLDPSSRIHVVTGPNMAGKSTFLRQTALIAILAQTGSFVPADHAVIGIVDKVFSRVGAKDDLFHDRSTFMVEMLETSDILHRATPRSLVIMDEVGRGTTVKDGLAIAFATIHHLARENKCRALFATHFHELSTMLGCSENKGSGAFKDVAFFCTGIDETDEDHFSYSYRVKPGVNYDSHGLKVAQLAGMPDSVMSVSKKVLQRLGSPGGTNLGTLGQLLTGPDSN